MAAIRNLNTRNNTTYENISYQKIIINNMCFKMFLETFFKSCNRDGLSKRQLISSGTFESNFTSLLKDSDALIPVFTNRSNTDTF